MAVCVLIQLILVHNGSVFGYSGASEAVRGAGLLTVVWVWRAVSNWPGCWGGNKFVVRVGFRAGDVVIGMGRVSVAYMYEQCICYWLVSLAGRLAGRKVLTLFG